MISINDYDTGFQIAPSTVKRLKSVSGILINQLNNVPMFFVKEETMDKHCNNLCLRRGCFEEIIQLYNGENSEGRYYLMREENIRSLIEKMERCMGKCNAVACYVPQGDDICKESHILICQERIKYRSKKQFEYILLEIILHELAHAYFSTGNDLKEFSKHVIEESLCEAYAFSKLDDSEELFEFMSDQKRPPEYTSFKFWTEISRNSPLILLLNAWRMKNYKQFPFALFPVPYEMYFNYSRGLEQIALLVLSFS